MEGFKKIMFCGLHVNPQCEERNVLNRSDSAFDFRNEILVLSIDAYQHGLSISRFEKSSGAKRKFLATFWNTIFSAEDLILKLKFFWRFVEETDSRGASEAHETHIPPQLLRGNYNSTLHLFVMRQDSRAPYTGHRLSFTLFRHMQCSDYRQQG